jgi:C1A family cysteine protease
MPGLDARALNAELQNVNARWQAKEAPEDFALGFTPGPEDHTIEERESLALANHKRFMAMAAAAAAPPYPVALDWRHLPAHAPLPAGNYVTPVKNQRTCGSCVAFGTLASFESAIRIHDKSPTKAVDLSEADLFYCHAEAEQGRRCSGPSGGWWPDAALTVCQNVGVVDEACFPYTPGDQPCHKCADWKHRLTKIKAWHKMTTPTAMKQWIAQRGPVVTCISVYADFYNYHTGVYHHVSGALQGGHCICCVGYDDAKRYWICKNSWDTTWGDHGFVNIAYGQVGVDAAMWALEY